MVITDIIVILIAILTIAIYIFKNKQIKQLKDEVNELRSLTKSQQVKYGKSFEHFVPFIKDFPADREKTVFLGMPLDFIAFEEDYIKFIEVKTGISQLSSKQKRIKELVEKKQVIWCELRY